MPKSKRKLTPKQDLFVHEYLVDLNAKQAAIRAGYSPKTAEWIGPQLLQKTHVQDELAKRQARRSARLEIRAEDVLRRLLASAENGQQLIPVVGLDGQQIIGKDGQPVWRQLDASNANKALELIGKHVGLFNDKLTLSLEGDAALILAAKRVGEAKE